MNLNKKNNLICYICENEYNYFLAKKNVIGVGLGYKSINSFYTNSKCIKVFVINKVPSYALNSKDVVPKFYKGIQTDVVQSSIINAESLTQKIRPVVGGYSIGNSINTESGSLGCLVKKNGDIFILSSSHVLAYKNYIPIYVGCPIIQPGVDDGGHVTEDVVAFLNNFTHIEFITSFTQPSNYTDCAIAKLSNPSIASSKIAFIGIPKGVASPKLDENVQKVGRTTELTKAKIIATNGTFLASYGLKQALFKKQIVTNKMSLAGDSGSLLLDKNNYILGLLLGSNESYSYFNYISEVLNELSISIVTY